MLESDKFSTALSVVEVLEPLFKIFYTFVFKKIPGKITDKYVENLRQASWEIYAQIRPKIFLVQSFA